MISLIVCCKQKDISPDLRENIGQTIGVACEIIVVDNSRNEHSIFSAYNLGAEKAQYEVVCFLHDDILFRSNNWGEHVLSVLGNKEVGLLGVAGATYKTSVLSPWWISNYADMNRYVRCNILQHSSSGVVLKTQPSEKGNREIFEVVILDGVWLCCRKELWKLLKFDETYKGFHFYDLDFSMRTFVQGLHNYVTHQVLIEHFSAGHMDKEWIEAAKRFHDKWKSHLPAQIGTLVGREKRRIKREALKNLLHTLSLNEYNDHFTWFKNWIYYWVASPLNREAYSILRAKLK